MRFDVLTLFPEIFSSYLGQSLLAKAIAGDLVEVHSHDMRKWANDKHNRVDDRPFGGGAGMVIRAEPVVECVEAVQQEKSQPGRLIMLTPQGRRLDQPLVEELSLEPRLLLLCGRYEGFDQRVSDLLQPEEISIGDYVLNGGEVAAMAIIDAVIRLIPGVLGDETSSVDDSFSSGNRLLEFPQYTRPRVYRGLAAPDVLLSGDHAQIAAWRKQESIKRTKRRRADLLDRNAESEDE
ncbi:tRNA (guanosine(37)-N1)-methyltransferase TrmD [Blastopirellula sp. J2-11]|uniref:tRNA (guanosine(37)-N1)-methyltransferase TrmD n=1 Tax=Blastopirellula sp. J2-11 TaxID=2943192 RepID=UPI0021C5B934|nr:tRNA (guanosine(37)-N1)-methyltransferase TrmD [Blastopirellula sp. J2-11]UUO05514.1 tRNA (guanosine(37)-N1)-methyltransferase TrmD [Blastopirellula sp. J2-11]